MAYRFIEETFAPTDNILETVSVTNGGTGYAVDDILTVAGGTGTAATLRVTAETSGVIDTVAIETSGSYSISPATTNVPTGGSGSGAETLLGFQPARGYVTASKGLMDALAANHVTSVSLVAGGSAYTLGDILTVSSGTALYNCRVEVTAESAGVVTEVVMRSSGAFTTLPDLTAVSHPTTGGSGTGCTISVDTVEGGYAGAPDTAGTGYAVGDVVTLTGGTLHAGSSAMQFIVTAETGGVVDTVAPYRFGRYDVLPTNPVATTGGGSSLTLNLTQVSWVHPDATSENYFDAISDFSWWLRGVNNAGGDPLCGISTMRFGALRWWGLKCATSFDDTRTFENQPNASPGDYTDPSTSGGARMCAADQATTVFVGWSARTINIVLRTSPTYEHGYMGLFLPFVDSPATKYPFPLLCAGTTHRETIGINDSFAGRTSSTSQSHSSILHHGTQSSSGPSFARNLTGAWITFAPESALTTAGFRLWPLNGDYGNADAALAPNLETGSGVVIPDEPGTVFNAALGDKSSGTGSDGPYNSNTALGPTPFGPGGADLYFLTAPLMYEITGSVIQVYGELEGVFYINGRGLSSEDRISDADGSRFFVFTDTLSNENRNFIALREGN